VMSLRGVAVLVNVVKQVGYGRSVRTPISLDKAWSESAVCAKTRGLGTGSTIRAINREVSGEPRFLNMNPSLP
jgi:hypothetical protein